MTLLTDITINAEFVRYLIVVLTIGIGSISVGLLLYWHSSNKHDFDLKGLFMSMGTDGKQHPSRPAMAEMVALFATTSGYLTTLAIKPESFELYTLVYGGLWVVRGGYATYLKSKNGHSTPEPTQNHST